MYPKRMKYLYLLIILCLCNRQAYAQHADSLHMPPSWDSLSTLMDEAYGNRNIPLAIRYAEAALPIVVKEFGLEDSTYGYVLSSLAVYYKMQGRLQEAVELNQQANANFRQSLGLDSQTYWTHYQNMARLQQAMGNYGQALAMLLEAQANMLHLVGKNDHVYCNITSNLGLLYLDIGQNEKAVSSFLEARQHYKNVVGKDHPSYGRVQNNLALAYLKTGQYDEAETLFKLAIENTIANYGANHSETATGYNNLAGVYRRTGRLQEALELSKQTFAIAEQQLPAAHPNYALWQNNLAGAYKDLGQFEVALPIFKDARALMATSVGEDHTLYSRALYSLVATYAALGETDSLWATYQQALQSTLTIIGNQFGYMTEIEKAGFLNLLKTDFDACASIFYRLGNRLPQGSGAIYNNELVLKSMILGNTVAMRQQIQASASPHIAALYDAWNSQKSFLSKEYAYPKQYRSALVDSIEQEVNKLERELVTYSAAFANSQNETNITWQQVQQKLKPAEAAIELVSFNYQNNFWTDSVLYAALIIRPGMESPPYVPLFEQQQLDAILQLDDTDNNTEALVSQLYASRGGIGVAATSQLPSAQLYNLIWQPLESYLTGVKKIYLSPTGALHQVALHALPDGEGKWLLNKYDLHYLTSTRLLVNPRQVDISGKTFQAYGGISYTLSDTAWSDLARKQTAVPTPHMALAEWQTQAKLTASRGEGNNRGWVALPGTLIEVTNISGLLNKYQWQTQTYTGGQALEERFKTNSDSLAPDVLHIATHGFFYSKPRGNTSTITDATVYSQATDPMLRSGLILAGGNRDWQQKPLPDGVENGILTAYEVAQLDLSNTDLVVLSACETGLGDVQGSEGVYGLQRAFKQAGANYLLLSLWKVPDAQTVELMELFYKDWLKGTDLSEAFRKAQLKMSQKYSPYEWAAFKLVR